MNFPPVSLILTLRLQLWENILWSSSVDTGHWTVDTLSTVKVTEFGWKMTFVQESSNHMIIWHPCPLWEIEWVSLWLKFLRKRETFETCGGTAEDWVGPPLASWLNPLVEIFFPHQLKLTYRAHKHIFEPSTLTARAQWPDIGWTFFWQGENVERQ